MPLYFLFFYFLLSLSLLSYLLFYFPSCHISLVPHFHLSSSVFPFYFLQISSLPFSSCVPTAQLEPRQPRYFRFIDHSQLDTHPLSRTPPNE